MAYDYPIGNAPHAPPGQNPYPRSYNNNRGRGYARNRGGYNGRNGERNYNSGSYDSRMNRGAPAFSSIQPTPLAPWGVQYGHYPYAPPHAYIPNAPGPWSPPGSHQFPYSRSQNTASNIPPQRATSNTFAAAQAHITTPTYNITTPKAAVMSPTASTHAAHSPGGTASDARGVDAVGVKDTSATNTTIPQPAQPTISGTQDDATDSSHVLAPVPKRIHKLAPVPQNLPDATESDSPVLKKFVPKEGRVSVMDAAHSTPEATVKLLDHEALVQLQVFNIALARKLQLSLEEAKTTHEAQEAMFIKKRGILLGLLQAARESERVLERNVHIAYDRFYDKMKEACTLQGEAKENAQISVTKQLKSAPELSRKASEERERIEKYRNELNTLDDSRAISRNIYSDAIHHVLMRALGGKALEQYSGFDQDNIATSAGPAEVKSAAKKTSISIARAQDDRKDSGAAPLPQMEQLKAQLPVIERQPETEHQSIGEALNRNKAADTPKKSEELTIAIDSDDAKGKEQQDFHLTSHFGVSPTTVKNAIAITMGEGSEDYWLPESLKKSTLQADNTQTVAQGETQEGDKKGKAISKQEKSGNSMLEVTSGNKDEHTTATAATNDNDSKTPHTSTPQTDQPATQSKPRKKKQYNNKKKKKNGNGKDKGAGGMANATPKAGPAADEMRKGG